jgi:hypothetical protein
MYVIELFLPLYYNKGGRVPKAVFTRTKQELETRFGGLTAYSRAPADGSWTSGGMKMVHDELIVYEVISARLDKKWWALTRRELEKRFRQQNVLIRAHAVVKL